MRLKYSKSLNEWILRMRNGQRMVKHEQDNNNINMTNISLFFAQTNIFSREQNPKRNCIDRNDFDNNVKIYGVIIISKRVFLLNIFVLEKKMPLFMDSRQDGNRMLNAMDLCLSLPI